MRKSARSLLGVSVCVIRLLFSQHGPCLGLNDHGQLGSDAGPRATDPTAVDALSVHVDVRGVGAGRSHTICFTGHLVHCTSHRV